MARIIWSPRATWQLDELLEYIAVDSEFQAKRVAQKINASVKRLEIFPEIGAVVPKFSAQGLREVLAFRYRIFYQLHKDNEIVRIVAVGHGARQLTDEMIGE